MKTVTRASPLYVAVLLLSLSGARGGAAEPTFCGEHPEDSATGSSLGRPSRGRLLGAVALVSDAWVRLLPRRHARRCLNWSTPRMVEALRHAGASVRARLASSPPLGVGDLSRARGGPIAPYSRSHQSGRDSDLAFYRLDAQGAPVVADDLIRFDAQGQTRDGAQTFDAERNWLLVQALLEDRTIEVEWMFISEPLRKTLLAEAAREGAPAELAQRAARLLHQPSDAPPHDDHLHLRLRCTAAESRAGCMG